MTLQQTNNKPSGKQMKMLNVEANDAFELTFNLKVKYNSDLQIEKIMRST